MPHLGAQSSLTYLVYAALLFRGNLRNLSPAGAWTGVGRRTSALNRRAPHVGRGTLFFYGNLRHLAHVEGRAVYRFNCGFLWEAVSFLLKWHEKTCI